MTKQKQTILLVEDDDVYRESVHRLLDQQFDLLDAATGQDALALLESSAPACVLLDFRLPDYTGLELLPKLLEQRLAVVMLTAEGSERIAVQALQQGCQDYLVKSDLTSALLTRAIFSAIERNSLRLQMERQRQELEYFVTTAAHDLRGPLRAINVFSKFAEQDMEKGNLDSLPKYLQTVQQSAARLTGMVDALLEYTRVDARERRHEIIDLAESIKLLSAEFQIMLDECDGRIETGTLPSVHGDPQLLPQLLQNLIGNALKFRGDDPPVVRIDAQRVGDDWQVSVADNGIGIDPQHHEEVFKPLRRLHAADKYDGHGIGLATCTRIVEKHAGDIWVESVPGQGSAFYFTLPTNA